MMERRSDDPRIVSICDKVEKIEKKTNEMYDCIVGDLKTGGLNDRVTRLEASKKGLTRFFWLIATISLATLIEKIMKLFN